MRYTRPGVRILDTLAFTTKPAFDHSPDTLYLIFVLSGRGTRVRGFESPIGISRARMHPIRALFYGKMQKSML